MIEELLHHLVEKDVLCLQHFRFLNTTTFTVSFKQNNKEKENFDFLQLEHTPVAQPRKAECNEFKCKSLLNNCIIDLKFDQNLMQIFSNQTIQTAINDPHLADQKLSEWGI